MEPCHGYSNAVHAYVTCQQATVEFLDIQRWKYTTDVNPTKMDFTRKSLVFPIVVQWADVSLSRNFKRQGPPDIITGPGDLTQANQSLAKI